MMKALLSLLLIAQTVLLNAEPAAKKVAHDNSEFALSLYRTVNKEPSSMVFSPYSIFNCLSMVYLGARKETAQEMQNALHVSLSKKDFSKANAALMRSFLANDSLLTANGLWLDRDTFVLSDFRHTIENDFSAKLQTLDFTNTEEAVSIINEWTANQTKNKIPALLQEGDVDATTRMVLTNALYFSGTWAKPFDSKATKTAPFFTDETLSTPVEMMEQTNTFSYWSDETMQMLLLPFNKKEGSISSLACLFLLPGTRTGIEELENNLSIPQLEETLDKVTTERVQIKLPKFCIDQRFDLNQALMTLGMKRAFFDQADFSGIDGMMDLFLSKVVHEAYFSLDEKGVTAAAATGASMNFTVAPSQKPPIPFIADHPFLFLLVDLDTKTILFFGKFQNPDGTSCEE